MASRSGKSDEKNTGVGGENVRNSKGKLSKQSKRRRRLRTGEESYADALVGEGSLSDKLKKRRKKLAKENK